MSVRTCRAGAGGLALAAALALSAAPAAGQSVDWDKVARKPDLVAGTDLNKMNDLQFGRAAVGGPDLAQNRVYLQKFARALVYPATLKSYYVPADSGSLKPRADEENFDTVLRALAERVLAPTPANGIERMAPAQAEYVTEFGAALDKALADVFAVPNAPPVVRANAARLLAAAAKSGAPVHGKMIQAMLTNQYFKKDGKPVETPPEVFLYALKAAGSLLSAYDLTVQNSPAAARHTLPEADLLEFVAVLQNLVVKGPDVAGKAAVPAVDPFGAAITVPPTAPAPAPGAPAAKPAAPAAGALDAKGLTPDQARLVVYFRREAVRALAQCRFDLLGGRGGSKDVRPGFTLAQVAVSDSALSLPATPAEAAEAAIGLCNMAPSRDLDLTVYAAAVAAGVRLTAGPRVAEPADRSLPWRVVSARLAQAVTGLKAGTATNARLKLAAKPITELADTVLNDVAAPLGRSAEGGNVPPSVDQLNNWLQNYAAWLAPTAPAGASKAMYADKPAEFTLKPRPAGR